jgi:hypothetical protein
MSAAYAFTRHSIVSVIVNTASTSVMISPPSGCAEGAQRSRNRIR